MLKEQSALVKTKPFLHGWVFSQACFGKIKVSYHGVFAMIVLFACIACAFPLFLDRGNEIPNANKVLFGRQRTDKW
jgi:hypothetical protein